MCGRLRHFFYKESPSFMGMVHDDYKIDGRTGVWGGTGYATEVITATGGGYQHLFNAAGLSHDEGGDIGVKRFWSDTCVDRAPYKPEPECAVPTAFPSALVAPTAKGCMGRR